MSAIIKTVHVGGWQPAPRNEKLLLLASSSSLLVCPLLFSSPPSPLHPFAPLALPSSLLLLCDSFFFASPPSSSLLLNTLSLLFSKSQSLLLSSPLSLWSLPPASSLPFPLPFSFRPPCLLSPVPLQRDCSQNPLTFIPRCRYITILKKLSCVKGNPASDRSRCLQGFTLIWPRPGRPACLVFMHLMRSWKRLSDMLHKAAAAE